MDRSTWIEAMRKIGKEIHKYTISVDLDKREPSVCVVKKKKKKKKKKKNRDLETGFVEATNEKEEIEQTH